MSPETVIDGFILIGLLGFPAYSLYWAGYHLRGKRRRRLWAGIPPLLVWCMATYYCFLRLAFGCMGGGCAGKISPFLEFAVLYAFVSVVMVVLWHRFRDTSSV